MNLLQNKSQSLYLYFYYIIAISPVKEVPGSSPGWGDILFIFTLSPLGTKSQKWKKLSALPKLVSRLITQAILQPNLQP